MLPTGYDFFEVPTRTYFEFPFRALLVLILLFHGLMFLSFLLHRLARYCNSLTAPCSQPAARYQRLVIAFDQLKGVLALTEMDKAVMHGDLERMTQLYQEKRTWPANVTSTLAKAGHLACLKFAVTHGADINTMTGLAAAAGGHVEILTHLLDYGVSLTSQMAAVAATHGHNAFVKALLYHSCPIDVDVYEAAATHGRLTCLEMLLEHHVLPVKKERILSRAVEGGHVDCLVLLLNNGFAFSEKLMNLAVRAGQLDCVRVLHNRGCSWNVETTECAVNCNQLDCLDYCLQNNCPISSSASLMLLRSVRQ